MHKSILAIILIISTLLFSGCASNASSQKMAITNVPTGQPRNKTLVNNIIVGHVAGGHETNPMWESDVDNDGFKNALGLSLERAHLQGSPDDAKYRVDAILMDVDKPIIGFDMTVNTTVHYTLTNIAKDKAVYDKDIASSYTAKCGDNLIGAYRLQMANEGAIRENIQKFIFELYKLSAVAAK